MNGYVGTPVGLVLHSPSARLCVLHGLDIQTLGRHYILADLQDTVQQLARDDHADTTVEIINNGGSQEGFKERHLALAERHHTEAQGDLLSDIVSARHVDLQVTENNARAL